MSDTTKAETTQETDLLWTETYELAQVIARARKLAMEERAIVMRQAQELTRLRAERDAEIARVVRLTERLGTVTAENDRLRAAVTAAEKEGG